MCRILIIAHFLLCLVACAGGDLEQAGQAAPELGVEALTNMNILVIGGTSGIGLETVKLALDRGHNVTAMSRRPERMALTHEKLATAKGDVSSSEMVENAIAGHDAVVFTIGIGPTRKPVSVFSDGIRNVLGSMRKLGVLQLIAVTGIGAGDSRGHGTFGYNHFTQPFLLKTIYEDKDRAELLIRKSQVNWTIVRPGFLNDDASEAQYRVISDMEGITSSDISRADVAHFILSALEGDNYRNATVLLSN